MAPSPRPALPPGALTRRAFVVGVLAAGAAACGSSGDRDAGSTSGAPATVPGSSSTTAGTTLPPPATAGPSTTTVKPTSTTSTTSTASTRSTSSPASTTSSSAPASSSPARFVTRGPEDRDEVALTFHTNGDLKLAQRVLDICREGGGAVFTSFIIGNWLEANPTWAAKLTDAGCELANHTYTHPDFAGLSPTAMTSEVTRCRDVIARLHGDGGRFFRPSGTDDGLATPSPAILQAAGAAGYGIVLGWDVEPFDYRDPGRAAVASRVLDGVRRGSIVSLHFGHQGTVDALAEILDGLRAKGLQPVTASTLLG